MVNIYYLYLYKIIIKNWVTGVAKNQLPIRRGRSRSQLSSSFNVSMTRHSITEQSNLTLRLIRQDTPRGEFIQKAFFQHQHITQ